MTKKREVAIVHFNTPELTEACVLSIRKQGFEGRVVIFENSRSWVTREGEKIEAKPYPAAEATGTGRRDVEIIDNSKGQLVDFDAELAKWKKDKDQGYSKGCNFGSVKHMMSVEWLVQNMDEPFVLADSDILLKAPIDDMFDDQYTAIGKTDGGMNVYGIERLLPFLCFINAPECHRLGIHYFDPQRAWAIMSDSKLYGKHYDTGASFCEDVKLCKGARLKRIDINERMIHMGSGSWLWKHKAGEWLAANAALWKPSPLEQGIKQVAICAIARQENRYICEWLDYYRSIGVAKVYLYDNYHGDEERLIDVVKPYVNAGFVELTDVGNKYRQQCLVYAQCYEQHRMEYAWIGFFDIDEFLRFEGKDIADFMTRYKTGDVLLVNWRTMTDSGLTHYDPRPVQERFTEVMPNDVCIKYPWPENLHIKCMVRGGLSPIHFGNNPHNPGRPQLRCIDAHGEPTEQKAFSKKIIHDTIWLDHYWTKTAEEWVNVKLSRGYHGDEHYTNMIKSQSDRNFFGVNERTPEKEQIQSALLFTNPNTQRIMEHVASTPQGNDQWRLIAEPGYLLKSKKSGNTYKTIDTRNLKMWEVVEDPNFVKPEVKPEKPTTEVAGTVTKADGKPQTKKRANRKGK